LPVKQLDSNAPSGIDSLDRKLSRIEPNRKKREQIVTVVGQQLTAHIGPLPSPETLRQYEDLLPGTAERIISMAERQSAHRIDLESTVVREQLKDSKRGQFIGLVIALAFLEPLFGWV
jgi:uncharacterized membrane protein